jgi:hypothetical protein
VKTTLRDIFPLTLPGPLLGPEISHSSAASQTDRDIVLDFRELSCFAVHCRLPLQTVMIEAADEVSRATNRVAITTDCRQLRSTRGSLSFHC